MSERQVNTKHELLVRRERVRATHFRVSAVELALHAEYPRVVSSEVEAALLYQRVPRDCLRKGIAERDVLNLDERAVVYAQRRYAVALVVTRTGTRVICPLVVLRPVVNAGYLVLRNA